MPRIENDAVYNHVLDEAQQHLNAAAAKLRDAQQYLETHPTPARLANGLAKDIAQIVAIASKNVDQLPGLPAEFTE